MLLDGPFQVTFWRTNLYPHPTHEVFCIHVISNTADFCDHILIKIIFLHFTVWVVHSELVSLISNSVAYCLTDLKNQISKIKYYHQVDTSRKINYSAQKTLQSQRKHDTFLDIFTFHLLKFSRILNFQTILGKSRQILLR